MSTETIGANAASAVTLDGLSKRYGSFLAVRDATLHIPRGEVFGLLGPNGAGKTTTIKMLMGVLRPSAGSASILGLDCFTRRVDVMRRVGYLPDEPAFYDHLRGGEILNFVGDMHGLTPRTVAERAAPLVRRFELTDALGEFAVNYSKGMKKKLALLAALLHEPEVLILDEPTNGLDPYATRALHELVRETAAAGRTVVFSTHLLEQADRLCTRAGVMHRGALVAEGALDDLRIRTTGRSDATLEEIFFAATGGAAAREAAGTASADPEAETPVGSTEAGTASNPTAERLNGDAP